MPISKILFSLKGRVNRSTFFLYSFMQGIIFVIIYNLFATNIIYTTIIWLLQIIAWIPLILKREHDRGFKGKKKMIWISTLTIILLVAPYISSQLML